MAFELWTDGIALIDRVARLFNKHYVARDPLSGIMDGANTTFYANYPPIMSSGSVGVYTSGSYITSGVDYTIDYDAGAFYLTNAPLTQPAASYTTAKYPESVIRSVLVAGFDEMEGWWYRGWTLSESLTSQIPIIETSSAAYVIDPNTGSDPAIGSGYFSTSRSQLNFYTKCTQLAFYRTLMGEHALSDFIWKEMGGLYIDKSMTVKNLEKAYNAVKDTIPKALEQAGYEVYGDALYGDAINPPHTREFVSHRFWQKASIAEGWSANTPYLGNMW